MMEEGTAIAAVPQGLGPRAVELLGRLIQADTVNPPGNEGPIQDFLQATLTEAGYECEQLSAEPGRPNLVARLRGDERRAHPDLPRPRRHGSRRSRRVELRSLGW